MAGTDDGLDLLKGAQDLGFVEFTKGLVSGVYDVVVDSQMEQLKAYAELLKQVSQTVEEYQLNVSGLDTTGSNPVTDNKDLLEDYIEEVLELGPPAGTGPYSADDDQFDKLVSHFGAQEMEGREANDVTAPKKDGDPYEIKQKYLKELVYDKIDSGTNEQYELLKQMVALGFARVDTTKGFVETGLTFNVTALDRESSYARDTDVKASSWYARGSARLGLKKFGLSVNGGYSASRLRVKTISDSKLSSTNLDATMMGRVRVEFATTSFNSVVSDS